MNDNAEQRRPTDAPAAYKTAQRPGQSGEQDQRIPGPSPLSPNATGPHPPYDRDDPEGLAAGKHVSSPPGPEKDVRPRKSGLLSPNITVIGGD